MISPSFKVLARGPAPSPDSIAAALAIGLSHHYVEAVRQGADLELEHVSGLDVRIWAPAWVLEMNEVHEVRQRVGGLAIGDANGLFLVERPDGLFAVGAGRLIRPTLRVVAADVTALLDGALGDLR